MLSMLKVILIPCLLSCLWPVNVFAASGPITVNVDVPPGEWKAARLKNLPKDAMVAVRVESNGEVLVALMLMLNQKSRALGAADFAVKNPSAFNTMTKLFQDDRHPLSARRGRCVLCWAKDSDLPKKWQSFLVPHMQTALLKKLRQKPTSWADLSLVEKELAAREKKPYKDSLTAHSLPLCGARSKHRVQSALRLATDPHRLTGQRLSGRLTPLRGRVLLSDLFTQPQQVFSLRTLWLERPTPGREWA